MIDIMPGTIEAVIPVPPRELSPNARVHWGARLRVQREYQRQVECAIAMSMATRGLIKPQWTAAVVDYRFVFRVRRRRDRDNLIASLKTAQDCLQRLRIVVDDSAVRIGSVEIDVDPHADADHVIMTIRSDHAATNATDRR
jgi:crossover junction endodeoxyribonuclease RusA